MIQAEFEMYEEDIRELKSQIDLKNDQIKKLQRKNKDLREKYEMKKSESKWLIFLINLNFV